MFISFLLSYHADTLPDVSDFFNLVHHSNSVICIADNALALRVERQLLACENVLACALAVSLQLAFRGLAGFAISSISISIW